MIDRNICKITAEAFFRTACAIDDMPSYKEFKNEMWAPFSVNLMLSCELYLKYLLFPYIELKSNEYKTHNIKKLFEKLELYNERLVNKIRGYYNDSFIDGKPFHELNDVLELNKNNFVDFRYLHERDSRIAMYSTDIAAVVRSLKRICDEQDNL